MCSSFYNRIEIDEKDQDLVQCHLKKYESVCQSTCKMNNLRYF
jgi:hypothetical protein